MLKLLNVVQSYGMIYMEDTRGELWSRLVRDDIVCTVNRDLISSYFLYKCVFTFTSPPPPKKNKFSTFQKRVYLYYLRFVFNFHLYISKNRSGNKRNLYFFIVFQKHYKASSLILRI
jgi:hypothetical protein